MRRDFALGEFADASAKLLLFIGKGKFHGGPLQYLVL